MKNMWATAKFTVALFCANFYLLEFFSIIKTKSKTEGGNKNG